MELHLRVPADRWCVTFNEFFQFVEDVRAAWLAGEILQSEAWQRYRNDQIEFNVGIAIINPHLGFIQPNYGD